MIRLHSLTTIILALLCHSAVAQSTAAAPIAESKPKPAVPTPKGPKPTFANLPYGKEDRQVLDFWRAETVDPAPVLFFIHGGGWVNGDKSSVYNSGLSAYLAAGISVVSIHYRFVPAATKAGIRPPVSWPLHDAARALQFVRSKAAEWHLDKTRIIASGGSAGACTSLWLAFHDDLAEPKSADPVERESTRLTAAAVMVPQTTLDPQQLKDWTPNSSYGGHAFGFAGDPKGGKTAFQKFLEGRESILPWIKEYSPYALVTADDPHVYLSFGMPPALGQAQKDPTHTANFGVKLQEHMKQIGVDCQLQYPGASEVRNPTVQAFVIEKLTGKK